MRNDEATDVARTCARNLASNCGYAVFPVSGNKRPTLDDGFYGASRDPDEIDRLWAHRPGPLVGIVTGGTSGIDVLDVDVEHPTAPQWLNAARKHMPPTRTFRTRRGGYHLYFRHAAGVRNSQSKLGRGIDVRGDGGYIIYWFSARFACEDHAPPSPWPGWLLECVIWKPAPAPVPISRKPTADHGDKAVEGVIRVVSGAREGQRNAVLYWGASRLKERIAEGQIGQGEASALLIAAARAAGLRETEAQRTVSSAWK